MKQERLPVPVREIISALEREAANTDTDPRWLAATELRRMVGWENRTLICNVITEYEPTISTGQHAASAVRSAIEATPTSLQCHHDLLRGPIDEEE